MKKEDKRFFLVGIYFAAVMLIYLVHMFITKTYTGILWSCNLGLGLFAFGFLTKNTKLIKGTISYIFPPNLLFMIAALIFLVTGISVFKINTAFDTVQNGIMGVWVHLFSANIALFYTRKIKPDKKSLVYSAVIFLVIFSLTLLFAPRDQNVNFLMSSKVLIGFDIPFLTIIWPFLVFFVVVIPVYHFQKILAKS